jgi:hypothetical protein
VAAFEAAELDEVEEAEDAAADLGLGRARPAGADAQAEGDVLEHRHVLEERVVLEHEAHPALLHGGPRGVLLAEEHRAFGRRFEAGEDAKQRRLAGAGGAEQRQELAGADVEVDAVQRREARELLGDLANLDVHGNASGQWRRADASASA